MAHAAGGKVSLTLSDPFCVDRHREAFLDLLEHHVDILFANEAEICSLYQLGDFDARLAGGARPLRGRRAHPRSAGLGDRGGRRGARGRRPSRRGLVDTTGAGDLYAAGFLFGLSRGLDLAACGRLGSLAAAEVISHVGARPATPLAELTAL